MSGSTVGGVAGAAIGYWVTGDAKGAQWGWMIGSAVGSAVDPDVIKGPRLKDAQIQTSMEGAPRSIVYGVAQVAGNVIMSGPLVETRNRDGGKGGPVQETYTYTRSYAIRICEGPIGGVRRVWRDDKLVYDARDPATPDDGTEASVWRALIEGMRSDSAVFANKATFYLGDETQLPDPTLEALPAENGGGMGNVNAHRGTAYMVVANDDLTERGGSIPQYRFEVTSAGSTGTVDYPATIGVETHQYTLPSDASGIFTAYQPNYSLATDDGVYVAYANPLLSHGVGSDAYIYSEFTDTFASLSGGTMEQDGGGYNTNFELVAAEPLQQWSISNAGGYCQVFRRGGYCRDLVIGGDPTWWYAEGTYLPEFGGLCWLDVNKRAKTGAVVIGSRRSGSPVVTRNRLYRWELGADPGQYEPNAISEKVCADDKVFWMHMDRAHSFWTLATDGHLKQWAGGLNVTADYALPATIPWFVDAFGVDAGYLFIYNRAGTSIKVYRMQTWELVQTITLTGSFDSYNCQIGFSNSSLFLRSGRYLHRIAYAPTCMVDVPAGWYALPDQPGFVTNGSSVMPLCSTEISTVSGESITLAEVVTDICSRAGVDSTQIDVSALTDTVRGFVIGQPMTAADAIRPLQRGYLFDFPEWGNSGETATQLRAVKRGGPVLFTITDDDLVESDDDEDTRPQALEFPRKLNLITSDPASNYEPTKQTFERRTDNVRAVGEDTLELPLAATRTEAAQMVEKLGKIAWTEAEGRTQFQLPEEFTALTPSDPFTKGGKRWRAENVELGDGIVSVEAVRDRVSAYTSSATGGTPLDPTTPTVNTKGPTRLVAANLPSLRSEDTTPGIYVGVCGLLAGWPGCDLYISYDGAETYVFAQRITRAATLGRLSNFCTGSSEPITVAATADLSSASSAQVAAGANAFAIIAGDGTPEIGQFETATETATGDFDLTTVTRGQQGTTAASHYAGEDFMLLDDAITRIPIDARYAGETLVLRAVTLGTALDNNEDVELVFDPPTFVIDGGEVT